jgi:AcrR family transcriptional regulator
MQKCKNCKNALTAIGSRAMESHRERKKQRTRERIVESAFALFADRGYQATTLADIAAAADIAPRTFFSYFPSKEAVVFHNFDAILASVQATLDERPDGETTLDMLRRWVGRELSPDRRIRDEEALRQALCREDPGLAAFQQHQQAKFEDVLRMGVARDLGEDPDSLRPKLVAAAMMVALVAIGAETRDRDEALALLDEAMVFLRGGVAALRDAQGGAGAADHRGRWP